MLLSILFNVNFPSKNWFIYETVSDNIIMFNILIFYVVKILRNDNSTNVFPMLFSTTKNIAIRLFRLWLLGNLNVFLIGTTKNIDIDFRCPVIVKLLQLRRPCYYEYMVLRLYYRNHVLTYLYNFELLRDYVVQNLYFRTPVLLYSYLGIWFWPSDRS